MDSLSGHSRTDGAHPTGFIGPFHIEGVIAHGGAGIVYRAMQESPIRRVVAVKVMRPGLVAQHFRERFDLERQVLARMHHPNVEGIIDAGTTDDGQPWFAMPLIEGLSITQHCDRANLPLPERIMLFLEVCAGVSHAHAKGIIHRDLKPSNVLIAAGDHDPTAKVIDFGIAKSSDADDEPTRDLTAHGLFLGTLAYTSPEQATLGTAHADARSDVFSLGALLHEIICGQSHLLVEPRQAGLSDLAKFEPTPMSARTESLARTNPVLAERVATDRATTLSSLVKHLRGDLDAIVLTALAPQPDRRYGTVDALAEDLRRFLDGRPVQATPPTRGYLLSRFVRRHRVESAAVVAAVAIVLGGLVTVSILFAQGRNLLATSERALYISSLAAADGAVARGEPGAALEALSVAPESQRSFEWYYRMRLANQTLQTAQFASQVYNLKYSPDRKKIALVGGEFNLIDAATFKVERTFGTRAPPGAASEFWWIVWSPDGTRLAGGGLKGDMEVWDSRTGEALASRPLGEDSAIGCWIGNDGFAVGLKDGRVRFLAPDTLKEIGEPIHVGGGEIVGMLAIPGGPMLVLARGALTAVDPQTRESLWSIPTLGNAVTMSLNPDRSRVAISHRGADAPAVHSTADGALVARLENGEGAWGISWSPDGGTIWTSGFDERVLAYDGTSFKLKRAFGGGVGQMWSVDSADDHTAITGEMSGAIRRWDLAAPGPRQSIKLSEFALTNAAGSLDGQFGFVADDRGVVNCVDLDEMRVVWTEQGGGRVVALRTIDENTLAVVREGGVIRMLDTGSGEARTEMDLKWGYATAAAISSDGQFLVVARGSELLGIEPANDKIRWRTELSRDRTTELAISHDAETIAAAADQRPIDVFDARTGGLLRSANGSGSTSGQVAFASDNRVVWTMTQEAATEVIAFDVRTAKVVAKFGSLRGMGRKLGIADRVDKAAAQSIMGMVKVFDPGRPDDLLSLEAMLGTGEEGGVMSRVPRFTPYAERLMLLQGDGVLEVLNGTPLPGNR